MTVVNPPYALQTTGIQHTAKLFRRVLAGLVGEGVADFNSAGDLKVVPSSPAAMSVRVERGFGFVKGDDSTDQGLYGVYNDGYTTVTVPAADATNPRKDLIVFAVDDATEGQAGDTSTLSLVQGTPAASPSEPALPATALKLAVVTVPANATSITSGNISDSRVAAHSASLTPGSDYIAGQELSTSTSYIDLTTVGPSVTTTIGPSGMALVCLYADLANTAAGAQTYMSFAVSGATTVAASDSRSLMNSSGANYHSNLGATFLETGLTPGSNTFRAKYRTNAGTSGWANRRIIVVPL